MIDVGREAQLEAELEREEALNKLLLDTSKSQNSVIKYFRKTIATLLICFTLIICIMVIGFFWYEGKFDTTTSDTTTTSMEVDGTNANINNVSDGDMYNDEAVHNEN